MFVEIMGTVVVVGTLLAIGTHVVRERARREDFMLRPIMANEAFDRLYAVFKSLKCDDRLDAIDHGAFDLARPGFNQLLKLHGLCSAHLVDRGFTAPNGRVVLVPCNYYNGGLWKRCCGDRLRVEAVKLAIQDGEEEAADKMLLSDGKPLPETRLNIVRTVKK